METPRRAVARVTGAGEVGGAALTPSHTKTGSAAHTLGGDHTCGARPRQADTGTHKGPPPHNTQHILTPQGKRETHSPDLCAHTHTHTQQPRRKHTLGLQAQTPTHASTHLHLTGAKLTRCPRP